MTAHPDEIQFNNFWQLLHAFGDAKDGGDYIDGAVALIPEIVDLHQGVVDHAFLASLRSAVPFDDVCDAIC